MKVSVLIIIGLMLIAFIVFAEHRPPNANLPVVNADYQSCVMVRNGPVRRNAKPILNKHFSEIV